MLPSHKDSLSPTEDPKLSNSFPKCVRMITVTISFSGKRYRKAVQYNISSHSSSTTFFAIMDEKLTSLYFSYCAGSEIVTPRCAWWYVDCIELKTTLASGSGETSALLLTTWKNLN